MWRALANSIGAAKWRTGAALAVAAAAAVVWLWTVRPSGELPAAGGAAVPASWPPEQRVAPPPLDARPENTWPFLRIAVVDEEGAPVAGAVVQVWADGRGCVDASFDLEFARPDVVDMGGRVTWLSGVRETGPDGVATLRVPMGTATHLVASDRTGRRAVLRVDGSDQCLAPCAGSDCGTCMELPCTYSRAQHDCAFPIRNFVLRMAHPVRVTGVVRDQSGRPVAGARVIAAHLGEHDDAPEAGRPWATTDPWPLDEWSRAARGAPHQEPAMSDASGRFAMSLADDGGRIVLVALAADHAVGVSGIRLGRGAVSADLRVRRGSHIALRATGPDGRPIAGAIPSLGDDPFAPTGPDGRVVLHGVSTDWREVQLRADGFATRTLRVLTGGEANVRLDWVPHARVEVVASKALLEELGDRAMVELSLVADSDRRGALADGSLERRTRRVELGPDATGRAVIERVPPGDYTVWVTWTGALIRGPRMRVAPAGPSIARVDLAADASLSGAVRDASGGPRHASDLACVQLAHETAPVATCALERDGRYRFTMIPAGRWALRHGQEPIGTVRVRPGANARDVAVEPVF